MFVSIISIYIYYIIGIRILVDTESGDKIVQYLDYRFRTQFGLRIIFGLKILPPLQRNKYGRFRCYILPHFVCFDQFNRNANSYFN